MSAAIGFALGPLLGGLLVEMFGWRAVYLFRFPLALVLTMLAVSRPLIHAKQEEGQRFDFAGALTLAASVAGFLLAFSRGRDLGWTSPLVLTLLAGSSATFAGFVVTERRTVAPVVDLSLFRHPTFAIANALNVFANCSMFAIWLLVPYYIVNALGYPAMTGGLLLTAAPLATALAAPLAGKLTDRLGTRVLSSMGLGLEALGLWSISQLDTNSSALTVLLVLGCVGLGLGMFQTPNMSFVMGAIPREQQGVAGGMSQMMRTLGVVLGVTSASMLFSSRRAIHAEQLQLPTIDDPQSFIPAFQEVFLVSAVVCLAAFGLSLLRGKSRP
jgi:MFS family permease